MKIAVLALQGAFLEHEMILRKLGVDCFEVRQKQDWLQEKASLYQVANTAKTINDNLYKTKMLRIPLYMWVRSIIIIHLKKRYLSITNHVQKVFMHVCMIEICFVQDRIKTQSVWVKVFVYVSQHS